MAAPSHEPGHEGMALDCPVACLGVGTVGDLVRLLARTARAAQTSVPVEAMSRGVPHLCGGTAVDCPIGCLGLSRRVLGALQRSHLKVQAVADVLRLLHCDELYRVEYIGPRSIGEIRAALAGAGFATTPDSASCGCSCEEQAGGTKLFP